MKEPLVVYIIADNRSGSTLLDYMLSCHPDAITLGEVHHLHGHYYRTGNGLTRNWECSCGKSVQQCDFWSEVLKKVSFQQDFETKMFKKEPKWAVFNKHMHAFFLKRTISNKSVLSQGQMVAQNTWKLYKSIHKQEKKAVIIDSSKIVLKAFFLAEHKEGNIRFLILERDIRAIAYSKLHRRREFNQEAKDYFNMKDGSIYRDILGSYKTRRENRIFSKLIEKSGREDIVKKITYEDLAEFPVKTMSEIYSFLEMEQVIPPLMTNQNKEQQHILCGSPTRFEAKRIKPDTRWESYFKGKPLAYKLGRFLQDL